MENLWKSFLEIAKDNFAESVFDTWITPMTIDKMDNTSLSLLVPNEFFRGWILENYMEQIKSIFAGLTEKNLNITIKVSKKESKKESSALRMHPTLISRYTFENFVTGPSNEFAHAAAMAIADNLGGQYNPLLIYSNVGLGKTHLMMAIGHAVYGKFSNKKILYYRANDFTNEMITGIRLQKMHEFRERFHSADLLLVDDIQFIAGKESTQTEFFNTFNALFESKKQIVLTSDRFPKQLQNIDDRLRNRFEWGLTVDIQPPEYETRIAILKNKASYHNVVLPEDIASFIGTNIKIDIRQMEGALIKVLAYASLTKKPLSLTLTKQLLEDFIPKENHIINIDSIQKIVAEYFQLKISDLKSHKKIKKIATPRQIAIYLSRKLTQLSLNEIGSKFGGKDHSTVIHSVNKVSRLIEEDEIIKKHIESINSMLINC